MILHLTSLSSATDLTGKTTNNKRKGDIMKKVAVITARSGSKGLPDKNIIDICGKPLMVYSIEAAIGSGLFERVIVSTDSPLYADIAKRAGAEVMMRGEKLSNDTATSYMVLEDFIARMDTPFDYFVLLQPTSPFRNAQHIKEACESFENNFDRVDFLVSVTQAAHASVLVKPIDEDGTLKHFDTDFSSYRRQNSKEYSPNGAIYIAKPDAYLANKHFFGKRALSYIMSAYESVDIDNKIDYEIACFLMDKKMREQKTELN